MKAIAADGPDGLINPAAWPVRADDLADTTGYEHAAGTLRGITAQIETHALDLGATWKALPGPYQAPELDQALALMPPVVQTATDASLDLAAAAGALEELASILQGLHPGLADLQARAEAFRADVAGGVMVEVVSGFGLTMDMAANASFLDLALSVLPGAPEPQRLIPWNQHRPSVERNAELCTEYALLYEQVSTAIADCANTINGRNPEHIGTPLEPVAAQWLLDPEQPMPWGAPVTEDRHWIEDILAAGRDFNYATIDNVARLGLGYDISTGERSQRIANEAAWEMISTLGSMGTALSMAVGRGLNPGAFDTMWRVAPSWATSWTAERQREGTASLAGIVGIDYTAHITGGDGLHRWREDGVHTAASSALNVGSFAAPSALGTAVGLSRLSRIARIEAHLAPDADGRPIVMWRDPDAPPPHTLEERATPTPGDGEVLFNARDRDLTPRETVELVRYTDAVNDIRLDGHLSPTGRVSTLGELTAQGRTARLDELARVRNTGTPYQGVAGHAADTAWTAQPRPREWHDQSRRLNASLGATIRPYPVGFQPTVFRALLPDGTIYPPREG